MRCPACGHKNLPGDDASDNCGASLLGAEDAKQTSLFDRLVGRHLRAVGATPPATIQASSPVDEAIEQMVRDGVDCLLVMSGDRLVGIFTDRDAVLKVGGRTLGPTTVRDVMTPEPVVLRPDDTLAVAIHKMADGGYRHIPIVGDDGPIGVLSVRDVFRHVLALAG
jgi:CBS domain-containing protein